MEFGIEKMHNAINVKRQRHMTDGMELPNHEKFRTLEEN